MCVHINKYSGNEFVVNTIKAKVKFCLSLMDNTRTDSAFSVCVRSCVLPYVCMFISEMRTELQNEPNNKAEILLGQM